MALSHRVIVGVGGGGSNNLRVCARLNCKEEKVAISKSLALCNITFIKVACIIMDYPGDSIDCQFELSLQYLEPGGKKMLNDTIKRQKMFVI